MFANEKGGRPLLPSGKKARLNRSATAMGRLCPSVQELVLAGFLLTQAQLKACLFH
jgi:hypothetical protein